MAKDEERIQAESVIPGLFTLKLRIRVILLWEVCDFFD